MASAFSGPSRERPAPAQRVIFHRICTIYYQRFPDAVVTIQVIYGAMEYIGDCPVRLFGEKSSVANAPS
jgi:hypothetical protein